MQETGISSHFLCKLEPANFFPSSLFRPFNAVCCRFLGRTKLNPRMSTSEERKREREKNVSPFSFPPFFDIYLFIYFPSPPPSVLRVESKETNPLSCFLVFVSHRTCHTHGRKKVNSLFFGGGPSAVFTNFLTKMYTHYTTDCSYVQGVFILFSIRRWERKSPRPHVALHKKVALEEFMSS